MYTWEGWEGKWGKHLVMSSCYWADANILLMISMQTLSKKLLWKIEFLMHPMFQIPFGFSVLHHILLDLESFLVWNCIFPICLGREIKRKKKEEIKWNRISRNKYVSYYPLIVIIVVYICSTFTLHILLSYLLFMTRMRKQCHHLHFTDKGIESVIF